LSKEAGAQILFKGKIIDVQRYTLSGFAEGKFKMEGTAEYSGKVVEVKFHNENVIATLDGKVIGCVPDLLTLCDSSTGLCKCCHL
jgi:DUF917 family protein